MDVNDGDRHCHILSRVALLFQLADVKENIRTKKSFFSQIMEEKHVFSSCEKRSLSLQKLRRWGINGK
jgi:hypothetical protein